jgi:hypothetical protein
MDAELIAQKVLARLGSERGTTLIETAIACGLVLVVTIGLLSMAALATAFTENHGHLEARTTEYAQDKMEQLLVVAYTDLHTNTVVFPAASTGGTGLAVGGGTDPAAPVDGYVDWLASDGSLLGGGATAPADWFYERVWQITSPSSGIKQITVTSTVRTSVAHSLLPKSTVVALKCAQF